MQFAKGKLDRKQYNNRAWSNGNQSGSYLKGRNILLLHEFFFIIKVEFPINNAAMKRNAIQIIIHLIFHFINLRCKGNIVLKCNTTMLFDWMIIAVHPQSCSLHFLDFVQFYAGNPSFNTSLNPICIEILPLNLYLVIQTIFNTLKELY